MVLTSVSALLVCLALGLVAEADPMRKTLTKNFEINLEDERDTENEVENIDSERYAREIEAFPRGLMAYNDDGFPIELSSTAGADGDESVLETRMSLTDRVHFHLYTRNNPVDYQELWINDEAAIKSSHFNAENPTYFVTHGWMNSGDSLACTLIRDAYLEKDDFNVIVIDWSGISKRPYIWASKHVSMIGQHVAKMINFLEARGYLSTKKSTLVGHSLGAHVMGLAAYHAEGTVNYVVGLDPAFPMFKYAGPDSRISFEDANHVQIIHTNAGRLGYEAAIGHSDFYPNGGWKQLGCGNDIIGACSHARSYIFFAESINSKTGFYGKPCTSYQEFNLGQCNTKSMAIMGGTLIGFVKPGKYFLATKPKALYANGI